MTGAVLVSPGSVAKLAGNGPFGLCSHAAMNSGSVSGVDVFPRVRQRTDRDLGHCVQVPAAVHEHDGCPVNWPELPDVWLTPPSLMASWVAELDGRAVGHIGLSRSDAGDAAPALWSARAGVSIDATAVVNRLFVTPWARGRGIGALLVTRAVTTVAVRCYAAAT